MNNEDNSVIDPVFMPDFRLSASNAGRWMTCPGWYPLNVFIQKRCPEKHRALRVLDNRSPDYMTDGRKAHALAAITLRDSLLVMNNALPLQYPGAEMTITYSGREEDLIDPEFMEKYHGFIEGYSSYIKDKIISILEVYKFKGKDQRNIKIHVFIENTITLKTPLSEHSTTPDTYIIVEYPDRPESTNRPASIWIFDFKFGAGEQVSANKNKQLCFYIVTAKQHHSNFNIKDAETVIYQPRCLFADSITSDQKYDFEDIIALEEIIYGRIEEVLKTPTDKLPPLELFKESDECGWCPHKVVCPAKEKAVELAKQVVIMPAADGGTAFPTVDYLTPERIKFLLDNLPGIVKFADSVKDYALARVKDGTLEIPGYELGDGRSARSWDTSMLSVDEIAEMLKERGVEEPFQPRKLRNITDIEDQIGKKQIDDLTRKSIPGTVLKKKKMPKLKEGLLALKNKEE